MWTWLTTSLPLMVSGPWFTKHHRTVLSLEYCTFDPNMLLPCWHVKAPKAGTLKKKKVKTEKNAQSHKQLLPHALGKKKIRRANNMLNWHNRIPQPRQWESPFLKEISAPWRGSHRLCVDLITARTSSLTAPRREWKALIRMPCGTLDPFFRWHRLLSFPKPSPFLPLSLAISPSL